MPVKVSSGSWCFGLNNKQAEGSANAALQSNAEWSSMVKIKTKTKPSIASKSASYPERAKLVSPDERRFNVIIYGIKECKKGTPRHVRTSNDMKSVSEIIQGICPDIPSQAIRDSVRLGRYTEGRNRPLLAKLNRSCDVLSILASRQKLVQSETPGVFIKPHQSPLERSTEATLLRQWKLLIESGTDKKDIRIRGNSIFVRKIKYGSANASEFKLHTPVIPSDSEETSDNILLSEPSIASAIQPIVPLKIMTFPTWSWSQPLIDYAAPATILELTHSIIRSHVATTMQEALLINCPNSNLQFIHPITILSLYLKHGYPIPSLTRKFYPPIIVFSVKTDILVVAEQ